MKERRRTSSSTGGHTGGTEEPARPPGEPGGPRGFEQLKRVRTSKRTSDREK